MIPPIRALAALLLMVSLTACATAGQTPSSKTSRTGAGLQGAMTQPFTDLSLMREVSPPVLVEAAAAPYDLTAGLDCAAAQAAIVRLNEALGPDVDAAPTKRPGAGSAMLIEALRSATALPYRGLIRKLSGAETRDRLRAQAVLAGMVRRGFLKGWMRAQACPDTTPQVAMSQIKAPDTPLGMLDIMPRLERTP